MKEQDFLDRIVTERIQSDSDFALAWPVAELLLEIARLRKASGLTQAEVAKRMGVPQPRVAEIERDPQRVSFGRILAYVNAVGASLAILPGQDSKKAVA